MTTRAETIRPLSPREIEVAELLAEGLGLEEIARRLGIRENTVKATLARAALKIPGDLPLRMRVEHWFNGGQTFRKAVTS